MTNALRTLLNGILDYAGIFPPAQLPLNEALANYARYRSEPEGWMLGRFVCPAALLAEIPAGTELPITAIARGGDTIANVIRGLKDDLADIAKSTAKVEVLEMRFPPALYGMSSERAAAGLFAAVEKSIVESKTPTLAVFFELPSGDFSPRSIASFTRALGMANAIGAMRKVDRVPPAGVKLRCAGKEYPSSEAVARVIANCAKNRLSLKFTGGLHQPMRHAEGHGFLNVFVAGAMAHALDLDEKAIVQILDAKSFSLSDLAITAEQIEAARKSFVTAFGSCSFDEPREGLRALKLI